MEFQYLDGGNSEIQDMQAEAYLYAPSGTVGVAATGVIDGLVVTQTSTASGSVLIGSGACINQASLGQGGSRLINPSQKTLDVFTANPVGGLPRNDIVVFDSVTKLILALIGTPNATPTDPTVPATSVALSRLRHAASATTIPTAKIDPLIVATTLRGVGDLPVHVHKSPTTGGALPYTASGSTVATPSGGGNIALPYGVTFTTAPWPLVSSGSSAIICAGFATDASNGGVTLYDAAGVIVTAGLRRVNWSATGILA